MTHSLLKATGQLKIYVCDAFVMLLVSNHGMFCSLGKNWGVEVTARLALLLNLSNAVDSKPPGGGRQPFRENRQLLKENRRIL